MELFDKKFVYFMWDDKLEGQKGFVANYINDLKLAVNQGYWTKYGPLHKGSDAYPFRTIVDERWCLCYCDPNYEIKKAFNDGKTIQFLSRQQQSTGEWIDVWYDCVGPNEPKFLEKVEYRVKPECPCEDGIDSKACVGCEHSEDGKQYRPYRDALEFIADYGKRFPTAKPRPIGTMPLIWIAHKTDGTTRLIVEFSDRSVKIGCKVKPVDFGKLFEYWTYTDGSPCGKEC